MQKIAVKRADRSTKKRRVNLVAVHHPWGVITNQQIKPGGVMQGGQRKGKDLETDGRGHETGRGRDRLRENVETVESAQGTAINHGQTPILTNFAVL